MIAYTHNHDDEIVYFGATNFRKRQTKFGIRTADRRQHMYIVGKTGMGKTTLLENLVIQDIEAGHGVAYIDPHGDTAEKLIEHIPANRINDVLYINPADRDFPVGFNVLEAVNPKNNHLLADGLIATFKKIWPDVWSPRMEYILQNCVYALLEVPHSTLLGISRILADRAYRDEVVSQLKDPIIKGFWEDEFAGYSEKFATEAIAPIQNKVGQFLSTSIIRNMVAQVTSSFDVREMMDSGKIIIVNLSKGRIGEENARLLGGLLITKMQLAIMERIDVDEEERRDFYLYVDEFQNFATDSFADILSEARKFRLNLIVAHQYIAQLLHGDSTKLRDAVFGNVGTLISMRVGATDAEFLEMEFEPHFMKNDLVNLPKHTIYLRLMIDGASSEPFSASTLPPISKPTDSGDKVIKVSRERYAVAREIIEDKIVRWRQALHESSVVAHAAKKTERRSFDSPRREKIEAQCADCGIIFNPPFRPDAGRPVYCPPCYEARKNNTRTANPSPTLLVTDETPSISLKDALKTNVKKFHKNKLS